MTVIAAVQAPAVRLLNDSATDRPKWIQIAYEGEWKGHHSGPFKLSRRHFEECVRNLRAHPAYRPGGGEDVIPFDFDHASEMPATSGTIPLSGKPAQAWVRELEIRNGSDGSAQLWSLTRVLEPARTYLSQKKIKWVSGAFWFDAIDHVTGEPCGTMLTSVAFTNQPFLRALPAIAATSQPHTTAGPMLTKSVRLLAALGLNLDATDDNITTKVEELAVENAKLKAEVVKLTAKDAEADVDVAMQAYQLPAPVRPALLSMRINDKTGFERDYPKPDPRLQGLGQRVADNATATGLTQSMYQLGAAPPPAAPAHRPASPMLASMTVDPSGRVIMGAPQQTPQHRAPSQVQPGNDPAIEFARKLLAVPGRNKTERAVNFVRSQPGGDKLSLEEANTQAGLMLVQNGIPRNIIDVTELLQTG